MRTSITRGRVVSELRIQDWFRLGMKREVATLLPPGPRALELGTRNAKELVPGLRGWSANLDRADGVRLPRPLRLLQFL